MVQFLILTNNQAGIDTVEITMRQLKVKYPGAIYHVMNRGDGREPIFREKEDRRRFMTTLGEACGKTVWQVQPLWLMGNHFHMVVADLKRRYWREEDLVRRARRDATKVALAVRLRAGTVMTVKWIAERLVRIPGAVGQ